eukprot:Awhi_evm2s3525
MKNFRIAVLFKMNKPSKKQRQATRFLRDRYLLTFFAVCLFFIVILIVCYCVFYPPYPETNVVSITNDGDKVCTTYIQSCFLALNPFLIFFTILKLIFVCVGVVMVMNTRNCPKTFKEHWSLRMAMYVSIKYVIQGTLTLVWTSLVLFSVVVQKMYSVVKGQNTETPSEGTNRKGPNHLITKSPSQPLPSINNERRFSLTPRGNTLKSTNDLIAEI